MRCHVERSETSRFILVSDLCRNDQRFFSSLRMTFLRSLIANFLSAVLLINMINLKAAPPSGGSSTIMFPPSTAQKWILPNGLTIIVQEDHSAPVASVQAWCATGSIYEDQYMGAGLSHILEHMLFQG